MKNLIRPLFVFLLLIATSVAGANPCEKAKTLAENDLLKDQKGRVIRILGQFLDGDYLIEDPETRRPQRLGYGEAHKLEQVGPAPACGKLLSNN